jgi:hypothetical protein
MTVIDATPIDLTQTARNIAELVLGENGSIQ